nr:Abi family protein [uncultured Niameybacter sp.]
MEFKLISEEEAKNFLRYNNYYFKLKSYAKNYEKYKNGPKAGNYLHLDFMYLKELSTIDMHIRKFVMDLTLSIEHFLKTELIRDFANNDQEDGYSIIDEFLSKYPHINATIDMRQGNSACTDLITKYIDNFAIWNIVEVLSYGDFIKLYNLYYTKYPSDTDMRNFLWEVKFLRNAAAHNNCLINSLKTSYIKSIKPNKQVNTFISKIPGVTAIARRNKMSNHVVHDFIVALFVFDKVVTSPSYKKKTYEELVQLFEGRVVANREYFEKNDVITSTYKFVKIIIDYFYRNCV